MHTSRIFAVGDLQHADFEAAKAWLTEQQAEYFVSLQDALDSLNTQSPPQWLMLFAAGRGTYSQRLIERWHRLTPLTKLLHIYGSWCEGETRTGKALAGVTRVSWNQFAARSQCLTRPAADYAGWWLPRSATAIDAGLHQRLAQRIFDGTVHIYADLHDDYLALADSVAACGLRPVSFIKAPPVLAADAVLWNACSMDRLARHQLGHILESTRGLPLIALLDFPRHHEVVEALSLGVTEVLSKPLLLGDLRGAFARCGLCTAVPSARRAG